MQSTLAYYFFPIFLRLWFLVLVIWLWYSDTDRVGKRQYGGLPKRCVYLRNTAGDGELPILQWINIDEVSVHVFKQ